MLTDQPLIINTINGKPMLTNSTLAPLGYTTIDLSDNGTATLECSINGENLTYTVKTTKQISERNEVISMQVVELTAESALAIADVL